MTTAKTGIDPYNKTEKKSSKKNLLLQKKRILDNFNKNNML